MSAPLARYEPTPAAALAQLEAVDPAAYARTRNHLDGAVTGLGPYVTHGFLSLPQVREHVVARHHLRADHKLIFELAWREYFRHVWAHEDEGILTSLHEGPLPDAAYARELPADLRQARTGVPTIDAAIRQLYATGTLHNHARMWLASYTVHLRKVHWRAGADWMLAHLLDGDLASNHLSWQWVAGTGSAKPYLFNADNVARYAPRGWHSPGTAVDRSYEELDRIARTPEAFPEPESTLDGIDAVDESPCHAAPPLLWQSAFTTPDAVHVAGRDVWLMHPWHLANPPATLPSADGSAPTDRARSARPRGPRTMAMERAALGLRSGPTGARNRAALDGTGARTSSPHWVRRARCTASTTGICRPRCAHCPSLLPRGCSTSLHAAAARSPPSGPRSADGRASAVPFARTEYAHRARPVRGRGLQPHASRQKRARRRASQRSRRREPPRADGSTRATTCLPTRTSTSTCTLECVHGATPERRIGYAARRVRHSAATLGRHESRRAAAAAAQRESITRRRQDVEVRDDGHRARLLARAHAFTLSRAVIFNEPLNFQRASGESSLCSDGTKTSRLTKS